MNYLSLFVFNLKSETIRRTNLFTYTDLGYFNGRFFTAGMHKYEFLFW
jgi:hypothetical protein